MITGATKMLCIYYGSENYPMQLLKIMYSSMKLRAKCDLEDEEFKIIVNRYLIKLNVSWNRTRAGRDGCALGLRRSLAVLSLLRPEGLLYLDSNWSYHCQRL